MKATRSKSLRSSSSEMRECGRPRLHGGVPGELDDSGTDGGFLDILNGDAAEDELGGEGGLVGVSSSSWAETVLPFVKSQATDGGV